jgi:GNAT superfamily N-acetyltransferase
VAARRHIRRYPLVSATLVGRLAVAAARQGQGLGALLLADAVQRAYASASSVGSSILVVDAISDEQRFSTKRTGSCVYRTLSAWCCRCRPLES